MLMASPVFFPLPETRHVDRERPLPRVGRFATRELSRRTNSDGCRVHRNYWNKRIFGCGGLQPSELFSAAL